MFTQPPSRTLPALAQTDSPSIAPDCRCQPDCLAPGSLSISAFAKRLGWVKLRCIPPARRFNQRPSTAQYRRVVRAFGRVSVSSALALALLGVSGGTAGAGYGPTGAAFRVNTAIVGDQEEPAIAAAANGNYVAVWQGPGENVSTKDIYAQRYSSAGAPLGVEFRVNTYTTGDQRLPAIAIDAAGDFVVAWQSFGQDGSGDGIFAQRFSSNGAALGVEFPVNSFTTSFQDAPAVAIDATGDFVVAWQSFGQDGDSNGIYAQRYNADGQKNGAEFQANTFTTGSQENAAVASDADGDFVIAWESAGQDGSSSGIYAQRFTSAGAQVGAEFRANSYTTNAQQTPAVASDAAGDFLIVWMSLEQDGSNYGVYAQRYAANGNPSGSEFRVNSYTTNAQSRPAVAMDATGDAIVTWESTLQNGNLDGVYAQRYDHTGAPAGAEFNLASYTTGGHAVPTVALDAAGDFVAAWEVYDPAGSAWDIYARQYAASAVQISQPIGGAKAVEGGATASYQLALSTIPTTTVTLTLTPADAQIDLGAGAGNARSLIFAADATALISQTVTVAAIDDTVSQGDRTTSISVSVASGDANYSGAGVPIVVDGQPTTAALLVAIGDNDPDRSIFVPLILH